MSTVNRSGTESTVANVHGRGRRRSEAGDTLIEVLLALVVLGLASVALLIAFSTSIAASAEHRKLATYDSVLTVASQSATAAIQSLPSLFDCTLSTYPTITLPSAYSGYTVQYAATNPVLYWDSATNKYDLTSCVAGVPRLITINIVGTSYYNSFVVDYSQGSSADVASTGVATKLVFLNNIVGGYAGSPFTTQPIVAIETDTNTIVTTDLSAVVFTVTSGTGTLSGCSGNEVLGVVTFSGCTIGSGGTFQITASDGMLATAPSNSFTVTASNFHLAFGNQPSGSYSGSAFATAPTVKVLNAQNNINTSWNGTVTLTLSGGEFYLPTATNANCPVATSPTSATLQVTNGVATLPSSCQFYGGFFYNPSSSPPTTATQYTMTATANPTSVTDSALPTTSSAFSVIGPGPSAQLAFSTQPTGVASGNPSTPFTGQPQVTVEDAFGNVVTSASNSLTMTLWQGSTSQSAGCSSPSPSNGTYTYSGCHGSAWGTGYSLKVTSGSLTSATSNNFDITNVAKTLSFQTSPVAGDSGSNFNVQPVLVVTDSAGLVVTSVTTALSDTNFSISPSGGTLSTCTGLAPSLGYYYLSNCTFTGLVGTPYTLTVTSGTLTPAISSTFSPTGPGLASQLVFTTQPVAGVSGAPLTTQPVVKVEDVAGNVVTTSTATITLSSSGGTLASCTGLGAAAGVVNVSNCSFAGVVGTPYTLTAAYSSLTPAVSSPITPSGPGVPFQVLLTGCPTSIVSQATCTATATIEDSYGNIETGDNSSVVTFSQVSGSGTVTGLGGVTVTGGVASDTLTGNLKGQATIAATGDSITSNSLVVTVNATTTVAVSANVNPSVVGQPVTYTATVAVNAPNSGPASGNVEFFDGATPIASCGGASGAVLNGSAQATCVATFTATSTHNVTAQYLGNGAAFYVASPVSPSISQSVTAASTSVAVTSNANPSVAGQKVTYTATVAVTAPGAGTPSSSDQVTFKDGSNTITCGAGSVGFNGTTATCVVTYTSTGTHSITAVFGGDTNFITSTSTAVSQSVSAANTTVSVASSVDPSVVGQTVTFTATVAVVAPGAGTPSSSDQVTFKDIGNPITCGTGSGGFNGTTATCTFKYLSASSSHLITAVFGGDVNFNASTSSALPQVVNATTTTVAVASSTNPSVLGQSVTYTATVSVSSPGSGTPSSSDTVTFKDGSNTITCGSGSVGFNGTTATCVVTNPTVTGTHSITAIFSGDASYNGSTSSPLAQKVNAATTTLLTPTSSSSVVVGQSVTYTATVAVTAPGTGTPTGNVEFFDGGNPISACGGVTGVAVNGSAKATCAANFATVGTHTITAQYLGNAASYYAASPASNSVSQSVTAAATTVSVSSNLSPTVLGAPVTYTATVAVTAPGSGTPSSLDAVTFKDGSNSITCAGTSQAFNGVSATCDIMYNSTGTHSITAVFGGDTNFATSTSSAIPQVINTATTTSLSSSANPSPVNQSVTYTATVAPVAPGTGTPSGYVEFLDGTAISTCGGSSGVLMSGGTATCSVTYSSAGTHSITAIYLGNAGAYYQYSGSSVLSQVVGSTGGTYSGDTGGSNLQNSYLYYFINQSTSNPSSSPTGNSFNPGVKETLTKLVLTTDSTSPSDQTVTVGLISSNGTWSATALSCTVPGNSGSTSCTVTGSVSVSKNTSLNVRGIGNTYHSGSWIVTYTQP